MLLSVHLFAGAAIGNAVQVLPGAPVIAFVLGVASHYMLDSLPHWEKLSGEKFPTLDTETPVEKWPKENLKSAIADVIVTAMFLWYALWRHSSVLHFYSSPIFWGAFGAVLPDLLTNTPFWNKIIVKWPVFKEERYVHEYFHITHESQRHMPKYLGLITQILVFLVSLTALVLFH